mgnify:CR=1 FL=1
MRIGMGNVVRAEYGTGGVRGVPARGERDLEVAGKYDVPVRVVIQPKEQ